MLQFISIMKIIISLLPSIIELMKTLESTIPNSGSGKEKLAIIKSTLEAGYSIASDAVVPFNKLWDSLQTIIGTLVTTFNITGIFKKD